MRAAAAAGESTNCFSVGRGCKLCKRIAAAITYHRSAEAEAKCDYKHYAIVCLTNHLLHDMWLKVVDSWVLVP